MMSESNDSTGTARLLHEQTEIDKLEKEYGSSVAVTVTTKAIQKRFPKITEEDVESCIKVNKIFMTGKIDIANEHENLNTKAKKVAQEIIKSFSESEQEEVEK